MSEAGVGAEQEEEVGEAVDGEAEVRARAAVPDVSSSVRPSRPRTWRPNGISVTWKPVPQMMASTGRSRPSAVTMPRARDLGDGVGDDLDVGLRQRR